ncbi:MAG: xylulokinase [Solirubrobacteraceae bacterium]
MALVGLDIGTSSVKGLALRPDGSVLAQAAEGLTVLSPRPGWSEQEPELWWRASERVLDALGAQVGEPEGIGLSGQMHGLVALDGRDRVLRPALLWNDQRTAAEADEIEARAGGLPALLTATGNRSLTGFTAPKLLWMERHEPDLHARIASLLLPKDYVRLRLCGERATDVTDASGSGWFDVRRRSWSPTMLEALRVPASWLPPALESEMPSGTTRSGAPVAAGAGDQAAGALGVGAASPGCGSVVLGTSGVVLSPLEGYAADAHGRLQASCHARPDGWFAMGVVLSAAGSLHWLRGILGFEVSAETLLGEAARWPPGVEGLTFLPYLTGERTPHANPYARGAFAGLSIRHDRGALVRAVLEGVAFALRDCVDLVTDLGGAPRTLRISGGGARSGLWLEILASVLQMPLERVAVDAGAAYGAAMLGGVAGGVWSSAAEAVTACVRASAAVEPVPEWVARYEELRGRFRALYPALNDRNQPSRL